MAIKRGRMGELKIGQDLKGGGRWFLSVRSVGQKSLFRKI